MGLFPGKYSVAMVKGDCSLTISNVDLKIDDGEWECQVSEGQLFSPKVWDISSRKELILMLITISKFADGK